MISRSHALAGIGYGALSVALVGLTAIGTSAVPVADVPGSADLTVERDTVQILAAETDAATLATERDSVQIGAVTVEPMAELTIERDAVTLGAAETDAAVVVVERDTCELTWEVES